MDADFKPLDIDDNARLLVLEKVVQQMAEDRMGLLMDLTLLKEQYELQAKELAHFKALASPEDRQLYRILKNN